MSYASLGDKSLPPWRERACHRDRPDGVLWGATFEQTKSEGVAAAMHGSGQRRDGRSRSRREQGAEASPSKSSADEGTRLA